MTTTKLKSTRKNKGRAKNQPKASPSRINERLRQAKAVELRLRGKQFQEIADTLDYADKSGAYRAVMAVLDAHEVENAEQLRAEQNARLDLLLASAMPKLTTAERWDAIRAVLSIEARRAKLMGIDLDPKASEILTAALAAASANATANVFIINGEKKRPEDLTFEELDIVEAHLITAGDDGAVADADSA